MSKRRNKTDALMHFVGSVCDDHIRVLQGKYALTKFSMPKFERNRLMSKRRNKTDALVHFVGSVFLQGKYALTKFSMLC
jgi:hypothetical protein